MSVCTAPPKLIFGSTPFFKGDVEEAKSWKALLHELGFDNIDSGQIYGKSETVLGQVNASAEFKIDTKMSTAFLKLPATKANVVKYARESLEKLQTDNINTYYLHAPDRTVPFEETMSGVQELYKAGMFKRFGLSNFLAHEVDKIIAVADEHGWIRPTVYQGNYSAVARLSEKELIPTLRKHGMSYYVYSASAGGFLTKAPEELVGPHWEDSTGTGMLYKDLYCKPRILEALREWGRLAAAENISKGEMAYRWCAFSRALTEGDALVVGASKPEQLREMVAWIAKGPLSSSVVQKIDELWETIEDVAPLDNYNSPSFI